MRLGSALPLGPADATAPDADYFARTAAELEALGFASVWVFDTIGRGYSMPDPLGALTVVATATKQVELGTGVLQLPWRQMPELAHRCFTLQLIAGGRLLLGVGSGSTEDDFVATGDEAFTSRFASFEAKLTELRSIFETGVSNERPLVPWPQVAAGPPLMIGAWRGPWVTRAAQNFDGWVASAAHNDDEVLADAIGRFRAAGGERAIVTNVQATTDLQPAIERLHRLRDLGFDDAVLFDLAHTPDRARVVLDALAAA